MKFISMMNDIREHVKDWYDRDEVAAYIRKVVNKEAFDRTGLVYGIGHAVYTISDPRKIILKEFVRKLVREKGCFDDEFALQEIIEAVAPGVIAKARICRIRPTRTSIFTAARSIICSMCRRRSLRRSSPSRASSAGPPTGWRS